MKTPFKTTNPAHKESHMLFRILIQDSKGALGRVLQIIYQGNLDLRSINISQTGMHDVGMLSIGIFMHQKLATAVSRKLEKIIEVFEVSFRELLDEDHRMAAYYTLHKSALTVGLNGLLNSHGGRVIHLDRDHLLIEQVAYQPAVEAFYQAVLGKGLLALCATPLNTDIHYATIE